MLHRLPLHQERLRQTVEELMLKPPRSNQSVDFGALEALVDGLLWHVILSEDNVLRLEHAKDDHEPLSVGHAGRVAGDAHVLGESPRDLLVDGGEHLDFRWWPRTRLQLDVLESGHVDEAHRDGHHVLLGEPLAGLRRQVEAVLDQHDVQVIGIVVLQFLPELLLFWVCELPLHLL